MNERLQESSFAYDSEFPPDVAEGLPLRSACRKRPERPSPLKRAVQGCVRLAGAARRG